MRTLVVKSSNSELQGQATVNQKGCRAIVLFRWGALAFSVYGFSNSQRANIDDHELNQGGCNTRLGIV